MKIEIRADGAHISGHVNVVERKSRPVITPHGKVIEEIEAVIQIVAALLLMLISLPGTCKKKKQVSKNPAKPSVFVDKAVKHNITVTGRAMGKENRVAKMPLGSLFVRTFDSYCSSCYNDDRKSLGGRYNGKIHHR